jgi:CheY-like chemotaxis protein
VGDLVAKPITILMADDDADDREMTHDAFVANRLANDLRFVEDGVELMDYFKRRGKYATAGAAPTPGIILLDLNMPKKDGREALEEIKADPKLREIPVIVLTTSKEEEDIHRSYQLHANSYITKPVTFESLISLVSTLGKYWMEIVELPKRQR